MVLFREMSSKNEKAQKMLGASRLIFTLDPKQELDAETVVLRSGQKFSCFVVHFCKYVCFGYKRKIVSKKVYALIWPVLEIASLNTLY